MFGLPEPTRYRLSRAPLVQAIVQIHYDLRARLQSLEGIAPIQEAVEALFPYMEEERVQQLLIGMGSAGPEQVQTDATRHWKLTDDDGWALTIAPNVASLTVGAGYSSVDEIKNRFTVVVQALATRAQVRRCMRLGVRYINIAEIPPTNPRAWAEWFRSELTGWAGSDALAGDLTVALSQVQVSAPPTGALGAATADVKAVIRHGVLPPHTLIPVIPPTQTDGLSFILDLDVFVDAPQRLDVARLVAQFEAFHGQIDRFFRWTLTPAGEAHFGLEVES